MKRSILTVFAALTAATLAAAPAQAFKLEGGSGSASGSQHFKADDNSPFYGPQRFDLETRDLGNGQSIYKWGGSELRIGTQPSPEADFRAGWDRMFNNPLGRPPN